MGCAFRLESTARHGDASLSTGTLAAAVGEGAVTVIRSVAYRPYTAANSTKARSRHTDRMTLTTGFKDAAQNPH